MENETYPKEVIAMADHLFPRFPTLSGVEILAIAAEAVEFFKKKEGK